MPKSFLAAMMSIIVPIMDKLCWSMNAASSYHLLPENSKVYIMAKNDTVICPQAILHASLKEQRKIQKRDIRSQMKNANDEQARALEEQLQDLKDIFPSFALALHAMFAFSLAIAIC